MMMTSNWIIVRKEKNFNSIPVIMNLWNWNLFCVNNQSLRTEWIVNFLIRKKMFIISIHSFNHCCCCCHCQCRCWEKVPMKKSKKKKNLHCKKNNNKKRDDFFSISMSIVLVGRSVGQSLTDENFWKWMKKLVIIRFDAALYTHTQTGTENDDENWDTSKASALMVVRIFYFPLYSGSFDTFSCCC